MQMMRSLRLFLLLWTFVVVPTLCPAGVIVHACHEEQDTGTACAHEEDCDVDPCLQTSMLGERPAIKNLVAFALIAAPLAIRFITTESATAQTADAAQSNFIGSNAAPFLPGAQPLLI
jgi:hypothetical protein